MRILLVEDHVDSARATQLMLQRAGYRVAIATDGMCAKALCAAEPFDLLLCDIGLPDGDGWELMRELHDHYGLKGIALTGYAYSGDITRSAQAGFAAHVNKPFEMANLLDVISKATA